MQKVDRPTSLTKLIENCGLPDLFTDYQIHHLGNPSGLPEILLKIDPWNTKNVVCSEHEVDKIQIYFELLRHV